MAQVQIPIQTQIPAPNGSAGAAAAAAAAAAASNGGGSAQFVLTSLYVGDLDPTVIDSQLYDLFSQIGEVLSVRVCRDVTTRRSLGYGYVNYGSPQEGQTVSLYSLPVSSMLLLLIQFTMAISALQLLAMFSPIIILKVEHLALKIVIALFGSAENVDYSAARALDVLNFTPINGKPIRVMYSHRDPSIRKSGAANIFIKNLDKAIDNKALYDTFSAFGNILSCKIATDPSGQSKGYGFVQFELEEAAKNAIDKLNGMLINDKKVYVGPFQRKLEREVSVTKTKFNNVFVKNLSDSTTDDDLKTVFGEYGTITNAAVMREADGKSKCFGFVNFENADDAARSVEALNGKKFDGKEWYVGKAQKKSERELELKGQFEQSVKESADKYQGLNLYLKNLDDSIDDDKLREMFSGFGTITSCKVMREPSGVSRGSGFVAFSTAEEASGALAEMHGKVVVGKRLYVALAQRKEDRRARLQAS
ncbi:Polyadenylate-binding protein 8 [Asimina triloba]